ncbi:hypothetical protein [Bacillus horti]|uniref:Uncharacterized protein n=1 Tax=Caldalkalibacillus horti TaxID=77523 RepID=A0ABT9VYZ7_9BACI|nr:hypothetical protein [Bacillus horti]MDQ0166203.1 hypothetical protein [Bacillus horti]
MKETITDWILVILFTYVFLKLISFVANSLFTSTDSFFVAIASLAVIMVSVILAIMSKRFVQDVYRSPN